MLTNVARWPLAGRFGGFGVEPCSEEVFLTPLGWADLGVGKFSNVYRRTGIGMDVPVQVGTNTQTHRERYRDECGQQRSFVTFAESFAGSQKQSVISYGDFKRSPDSFHLSVPS